MADKSDLIHPSALTPRIVEKVVARRGRLHAFETIDAAKTALVVIDLMTASVKEDANCRDLIQPLNELSAALRQAGGCVAWVTAAQFPARSPLSAIVGRRTAERYQAQAQPDNPDSSLWPGLVVAEEDIRVRKTGFSAFFPGKCDLPGLVAARGIEFVLIAGTVTNVCCESSARDAVELGYKVILVSDALAGHHFGLHEATLNTFYRIFGDVRPVKEVMQLIVSGPKYD